MALGSAAHTAVEIDLTHKIATGEDKPVEELQETFRDEFVKESENAEENPQKGETKGSYTDSGVKAVGAWHRQVAPKTFPAMVEQPIQFKINGIVMSGTIDYVGQDGVIGDWKFVGKKPASAGPYLLNMTGYAVGYRQLTGKVEKSVRLDHVVRTKDPYHFPIESDGPVPDESIVAYAGIVEDVAEAIGKGSFPPTGLQSGACSWCGYKDICPAYRAAEVGA